MMLVTDTSDDWHFFSGTVSVTGIFKTGIPLRVEFLA
jgi:hypothetical protein